MKVIVFGATGKTGDHCWRKAVAANHDVTVFGRSVERRYAPVAAAATLRGGDGGLRDRALFLAGYLSAFRGSLEELARLRDELASG